MSATSARSSASRRETEAVRRPAATRSRSGHAPQLIQPQVAVLLRRRTHADERDIGTLERFAQGDGSGKTPGRDAIPIWTRAATDPAPGCRSSPKAYPRR